MACTTFRRSGAAWGSPQGTTMVRDWSESVAMMRLWGCTMTYVLYTTLDRARARAGSAHSGRGHDTDKTRAGRRGTRQPGLPAAAVARSGRGALAAVAARGQRG